MIRSNVVPFRRRAPSKQEIEVYRWMTRSWSSGMKRLMFPQFYELESMKSRRSGS